LHAALWLLLRKRGVAHRRSTCETARIYLHYLTKSCTIPSRRRAILQLLTRVLSTSGAIWGGLLPTVIAIAVYFCFSDMILLSQTLYYNNITGGEKDAPRNRRSSFRTGSNNPTQPLISRRRSSVISRHRRDSARRRDSLSAILNDDPNRYAPLIRNILSLLAVCAAGTLGWLFAWWTGAWKVQHENTIDTDMPLGAEILGYASALLYLTARIPQIIRNHQKKSCEGQLR
jgi:hypothetical protein